MLKLIGVPCGIGVLSRSVMEKWQIWTQWTVLKKMALVKVQPNGVLDSF